MQNIGDFKSLVATSIILGSFWVMGVYSLLHLANRVYNICCVLGAEVRPTFASARIYVLVFQESFNMSNEAPIVEPESMSIAESKGEMRSEREPKKLSVNRVRFDPRLLDPTDSSTDSLTSKKSHDFGSNRTLPSENYVTNEAIPMTIFYRSQSSLQHGHKRRPTLQELRGGFTNVDKVKSVSL